MFEGVKGFADVQTVYLRSFLWLRSNRLGNALHIPLDFSEDFI